MMEWLQNPLVAIGIGIGVMFFGYFFGLFEGRGQGYKKRQREETEEKKTRPTPLQATSPLVASDEIPVLNVNLDTTGKLILKLDGKDVDTSALDAEQRKRLIAILTQMRPWLEASKAAPPPAQPQPAIASPPKPASQAAPEPVEVDDDDQDTGAPQSIVAQVDSVLQARLMGTSLEGKGIRLQESLEGGVIVWVGLQQFESVDDVPDELIKTAIKGAIAEWETKYTPGL